jgi:hypothetical protein
MSAEQGGSRETWPDRGRPGRFGRSHYPQVWVTSEAGKMPAVRFIGAEHVRSQQAASREPEDLSVERWKLEVERSTPNVQHSTLNSHEAGPGSGTCASSHAGAGFAMTRREFLRSATAATGAAVFALESQASLAGEKEGHGLVDVNVNLGRWPTRRLPCDEPGRLVAKLRSRGITQAWAGSLDGLLHKDLRAVNARLADDCRRYARGLLVPFGSINPKRPGWEEDFDCCVKIHRFRGIRLHPNYHGYSLDDPAFAHLLQRAAEHQLIVQLALVMEDERMMHPLLRVEPVDTGPLAELVRQTPGLRLVLINALGTLRSEPLRKLISTGDICVEISMLEGVGGVGSLLEQVPLGQILFGSHAPLFCFEAAEFKLQESPLTAEQRRAIRHGNAERLLTCRDAWARRAKP